MTPGEWAAAIETRIDNMAALAATSQTTIAECKELAEFAIVLIDWQDHIDARDFAPIVTDHEVAEYASRLDRIHTMCTEIVTTSTPQTATALLALDILDIANEPS